MAGERYHGWRLKELLGLYVSELYFVIISSPPSKGETCATLFLRQFVLNFRLVVQEMSQMCCKTFQLVTITGVFHARVLDFTVSHVPKATKVDYIWCCMCSNRYMF